VPGARQRERGSQTNAFACAGNEYSRQFDLDEWFSWGTLELTSWHAGFGKRRAEDAVEADGYEIRPILRSKRGNWPDFALKMAHFRGLSVYYFDNGLDDGKTQ
jgi:hypothetical protein